jgi:hypothetical protein
VEALEMVELAMVPASRRHQPANRRQMPIWI